MAPPAGKRRRNDDDSHKSKKKFVKKQKHYHSSSEDEYEDANVAQDAPRPKPNQGLKQSPKASVLPKSILKGLPAAKSDHGRPRPTLADDTHSLDDLEINTALNMAPQSDADDDEEESELAEDEDMDDLPETDEVDEGSGTEEEEASGEEDDEFDLESQTSSNLTRAKKRNDPTAFATSISKILDTKLTTSKRADPVLSRSKTAAEANKTLADNRLEQEVRAQMRAERKAALEKGRVKDVMGLDTPDVDTGAILEEEKRLKKTAQRGVVKLFNAVRAAQVRAEQGMREAKEQGVVGMKQREERVNEMSKQGFLDLISAGGKRSSTAAAAV